MRFIAELYLNGKVSIKTEISSESDEHAYAILAQQFPTAHFFFVDITTDIFAD